LTLEVPNYSFENPDSRRKKYRLEVSWSSEGKEKKYTRRKEGNVSINAEARF
jgi:hypothetical protein